ncbi:MAG: ATP-binding protein [Nitrospira sp.]
MNRSTVTFVKNEQMAMDEHVRELLKPHNSGLRSSGPYASSHEHLLAHIARLDLLVRLCLTRVRSDRQGEGDLKGLYISDAEVDALLQQKIGAPLWWEIPDTSDSIETKRVVESLGREIDARAAASRHGGLRLRLEALCEELALTSFDRDVLLLAMAPELDTRYERLYAYLQDDVTRKKPTIDLLLNLLCATVREKLEYRARFNRSAPLVRGHLVKVVEDPGYTHPPFISRYVKVDERIINYLLEADELDPGLAGYAEYLAPRAELATLSFDSDVTQRLQRLVDQANRCHAPLVFYFEGGYGVGKQSVAEGLCRTVEQGLLMLDLRRVALADRSVGETVLQAACREARLRKAALYCREFDLFLAEEKRLWLETFLAVLDTHRGVTFLAGALPWEPIDALHAVPFIRVPFGRPRFAERVRLWGTTLSTYGVNNGVLDVNELANKFHLSGGQIEDSTVTARNIALLRDPENPQPTMSDFIAACRLQSQRKLSTLARKIQPHYRWDDIILPTDRLQQLREICNQAKHRALVYEQWGFDKKLSLGKGLTMLFAGPSGTGKTMAADILAHELALDLYKIDLSMVVSKYIGETEKNLASIFNEAAHSNAILFFDEADALFGKRSEVRDAHDRYANIEVGFLLQKMEEYEGIVILATNFRKNMDDAFVRRLQCTVEFPFPSVEDRLRIWQGLWPLETPRCPDLNFDFMASQFEVSGGHIRNVALAATFLAAEDQAPVSMTHLLAAARREYQKIGKVIMEGDFALPDQGGDQHAS